MSDLLPSLPLGQQVSLPGHFNVPVVLEAARSPGRGFERRVRLMGDASPTVELSAPGKLRANWQSLVEDVAQTTGEKARNN